MRLGLLLLAAIGALALPSSAEAKRCGDVDSAGVANVRATGVSCRKARIVARAFRAAGPDFPRCCYPYRFRCRAGAFRDEMSRPATCSRGTARVRFLMFAS